MYWSLLLDCLFSAAKCILTMKRPRREIAGVARASLQSSDLPLRAIIIDDKASANKSSSDSSGVGISKNKKCMCVTLLAMATLAVYLGLWYIKRGEFVFDASMRHNFPVIDERCEAAAKQLKAQDIRLLALDFDLTVIDRHTGGRWKGTAEELAEHVRPDVQCLLNSAFNRQIDAAIVTFSEQIGLISNVTRQFFPGQYIPVHGWYTSSEGKQGHLLRAIRDINKSHGNTYVSNGTTILIDDDKRNIKKARKDGYGTIQYDPESDNPMVLVETIISNDY